jgi:hypothetical protein
MFGAELADKRASAEQKEAAAAKSYTDAGLAGIQAMQMFFGPQPNGPGGAMPQQPQMQPGMPMQGPPTVQ